MCLTVRGDMCGHVGYQEQLTVIEDLLCAKHSGKFSTWFISFNQHYVVICRPHMGDHPPAPPLPGLVAGPVDGKITEPCGHTFPASATASGAPAHSTPSCRDHCTCISTRLSGPMETLAFPVAAKKEPQQGSSKSLTPGINSDR